MADESTDLLISVARLYYLDGLGQHDVAAIVGVSRSTVSRLLTVARERGIVRISVDDYEPRDQAREARLRKQFGLQRAIVVKTLGDSTENVRRTIGYFAAPPLAQLIREGMSVGVAGGRTLCEVMHCLAPPKDPQHITVVQLMGNIGPSVSRIDALELGRTLAERFAGAFYMLNAPAFAQDMRTRDVFMSHEQMRAIWGRFNTLDLAFVGIGSLDDSAFVERSVLSPSEMAALKEQGAVGEICGRFFSEDGAECVSNVRDRVISIELDALRGRPEVIGVTNGSRRVAAVRAAIHGGLITSLVIDDIGADALCVER